ncbi:MAG: C1 family peptidase [Saprospiraceae bacterium]|nr:C1 family peptidase [Saprospiraceae bacterium]
MNVRIRFRFLLGLLFILCSSALSAQPTGLMMDDSTYEELPAGNLEKVKDHFIPTRYSLKAFAPFPSVQGKIASCVGWATGYGALTMERAIKAGISDRVYITDRLAHSAIFIYQNIKRGPDCQALASIDDALSFLHKNGDCLESTSPTPTVDCPLNSTPKAREEASKYTIETPGFRVFSGHDNPDKKVKSVKAHLAAGHPVIVGISEAPPYRSLVGEDLWHIEPRNKGGHAMVLVGYSDESQRFELMNSYGTSWGKQGFIDVSYQDFSRFCKQAFVLSNNLGTKGLDQQLSEHSVPVAVHAGINIWQNDHQAFEPLAFEVRDQIFRPLNDVSVYQPVNFTISVEKGRCAYLLNMDSEGVVKNIWHSEYPARDTTLKVPEEGWWEFPRAGQEMFCLLYGYEHLPYLDAFLKDVNSIPTPDLQSKIQQQKSVKSCDGVKLNYDANGIFGSSKLNSGIEKFITLFFSINVTS